MTNIQLYIAICVPTFFVLATYLLGRSDIRELKAEMNRRFDAIDAELRFFHGKDGAHDARLTLLEKGRTA